MPNAAAHTCKLGVAVWFAGCLRHVGGAKFPVGRGSCLGDCAGCHELVESLPRSLGGSASRLIDTTQASPAKLLEFLSTPETCDVQELYPLSLDREFWSLAALTGGSSQLGFTGAAQAVRSARSLCDASMDIAMHAYQEALLAAAECATGRSARAPGEPRCGTERVRQFASLLAHSWQGLGGAAAEASDVCGGGQCSSVEAGVGGPPELHGAVYVLAPRGNETLGLLRQYAQRITTVLSAAAAAGMVGAAWRSASPSQAPVAVAVAEQTGAHDALTQLSVVVALIARQMMDNLRVVWGIKNLVVELSPVFPRISSQMPAVRFHTNIYGRHWDVLEWLLQSLRRQQADGTWRPLRMAEMGVACGPIGLYLLLRFPELRYVGADPTIKPEVREAYRRFGDRAQLKAQTSEELHSSLGPEEQFDFVFVDGPHTYRNVRNDIEMWEPRVRSGGILSGHDFTAAHPPLLWAVLERWLESGRPGPVNNGMDGVWWWHAE